MKRPSFALFLTSALIFHTAIFAQPPELLWSTSTPTSYQYDYHYSVDVLQRRNGSYLNAINDNEYQGDGRVNLLSFQADGAYTGQHPFPDHYAHRTISMEGSDATGYLIAREPYTLYFGRYNEESYPHAKFTLVDSSLNVVQDWHFSGSAYNGRWPSDARIGPEGRFAYAAVNHWNEPSSLYRFDLQTGDLLSLGTFNELNAVQQLALSGDSLLYLRDYTGLRCFAADNPFGLRWTQPIGRGALDALPDGGCVAYHDGWVRAYNNLGDEQWSHEMEFVINDLVVQRDGRVLLLGAVQGLQSDSLKLVALSNGGELLWSWTHAGMPGSRCVGMTDDGGCVISYVEDYYTLVVLRLTGEIQLEVELAESIFVVPGESLLLDLSVISRMPVNTAATVTLQAKSALQTLPARVVQGEILAGDTTFVQDLAYPVPADAPFGWYTLTATLAAGPWTTTDGVGFSVQVNAVDNRTAGSLSTHFSLHPVHPNPFNSSTSITFDLNRPTPVNLTVFDLLGREVRVLLDDQPYAPGTHRVVWDASGLPGGTYFLRAQTEDEQQVRRMLFLK